MGNFGIKIKQYNNAIQELREKGYLIQETRNYYNFYEIPVITKKDNVVITFEDKKYNINTTTGNITFNTPPDFIF